MQRRNLLITVGTGGIATVAGCVSTESETTSDDEIASETSSSGEASGENAENSVEERTHAVGEIFTVGSGDRELEYVVDSISGASTLGNDVYGEDANGIFAVVEMEIKNKSNESFSISSDNYSILADTGGDELSVYDPSDGVAIAYDTDERFTTESILFEQLNPDLSIEGAVIFDIPEDTDFLFQIEPAGFLETSEPHFVPPS